MRRWSWVMVLLFVVLLPLVLFAAEAGEQSEAGNTIDWLWAIAWKLVGTVLAGFVLKLLAKLSEKYGIELKDSQKRFISELTLNAIGYAEEWSARKVKLGQVKATSDEKFQKAIKKLCEKVPGLTEIRARELIVSNLPKFRAMIEGKLANVVGG